MMVMSEEDCVARIIWTAKHSRIEEYDYAMQMLKRGPGPGHARMKRT